MTAVITYSQSLALEKAKAVNQHHPEVKMALYLTNWSVLVRDISKEDYAELEKLYLSSPINYIKAITEGYKVTKTPHEELMSAYYEIDKQIIATRNHPEEVETYQYNLGKRDGIDAVLDILNIKVKGINE